MLFVWWVVKGELKFKLVLKIQIMPAILLVALLSVHITIKYTQNFQPGELTMVVGM